MTWEFPAAAASDTGDKAGVDCFSSPHSFNCHIRMAHGGRHRLRPRFRRSPVPPHPIFRFGSVVAKSPHYFWSAYRARFVGEIVCGAAAAHLVAATQCPFIFVPTSRRDLSCRKKISFSRRDPSYPKSDGFPLSYLICFFGAGGPDEWDRQLVFPLKISPRRIFFARAPVIS